MERKKTTLTSYRSGNISKFYRLAAGRMRGNSLQDKSIVFNRRKVMDISMNNTSWNALPWSEFQIKLFRLQSRIYRAMQSGNIKQTIKLQKILLGSKFVHFVAVENIAKMYQRGILLNHHKYEFNNSFKLELVSLINENLQSWQHSPLQKISITTVNGQQQIVKIPNLEDMVIQCIWKYALEPTFIRKWSNRPKKFEMYSNKWAWGIQKKIVLNINKHNTKIVKIILNKYWDKATHKTLIRQLVFPLKYKVGLTKALKMGILDDMVNALKSPSSIIASLLVNMTFDDLTELQNNIPEQIYLCSKGRLCCGLVYENNIIYILQSHDDHDDFLNILKSCVRSKCLTLTNLVITKSTEGFDFLAWHFLAKKNGQVITYPSIKNWLRYKQKIKFTLKSTKYKINIRLKKLRSIVKNWYQYHQYCQMSRIKPQIQSLRYWCRCYMRKNTKMHRSQVDDAIKEIFY